MTEHLLHSPTSETMRGAFANAEPDNPLNASIKRVTERHGLKSLSLTWHTGCGGFFTFNAHRDHYSGLGFGKTIEAALAEALDDLNDKSGSIELEGELEASARHLAQMPAERRAMLEREWEQGA